MRTPEDVLPWEWAAKIIEHEETGCWLWIGSSGHKGYGVIGYKGRNSPAPRVIYQYLNGDVSRDLVMDHLCRVPPCVNPDHLEPVSQRENIIRGDMPGILRARHSSKTHCLRGHELSGSNLRIRVCASHTERVCIACKLVRNQESRREKRDRTSS